MIVKPFINRAMLLAFWFVVAICLNSRGADVLYVDKAGTTSFAQQQTKTAADFYGLGENIFLLTDKGEQSAVVKAIRDRKTIGVVLTIDVLPFLDKQQVLAALRRKEGGSIPLLIAGIYEGADAEVLKNWSSGSITGCETSIVEKGTGSYLFASVKGVTYELGGNTLPMDQSDVHYLMLDGTRAELIMTATTGNRELPVFARAKNGTQEIFFATASAAVEMAVGPSPYREPAVFASLAPQMVFLRYAGGERAWHSPGHYANLTVDDAWLREPYGYVNYEGLLEEMEQHNFHTTVAFVPWNFDRSQAAVVSLFRTHGDRFSLCIHGNNHDHQEFGAYDKKPLSGQMSDVKQSLARMAKFKDLTQLPYDPVMVFPHSISPEQTLALLKRYNFWATANSLNVPMGAEAPTDAEFALRTATLAFSNFPSLRRYSAEMPGPKSQLVVDAFLSNPMLFYVHQGFFASGIDAFDKTADTVNRLQPNTEWRSLGDIAQQLYLKRLRDDGNYDVWAFSGVIRLQNDQARDTTFFVEKEEDFGIPLTVRVDGRPYPYERWGKRLRIRLPVGKGLSRDIAITYTNDLDIAGIEISKNSLRIQAIRRLSDFRDDVVARTELGRRFIRSYSEDGADWNGIVAVLLGLTVLVAACWYRRRVARRSSISKSPSLPKAARRNSASREHLRKETGLRLGKS